MSMVMDRELYKAATTKLEGDYCIDSFNFQQTTVDKKNNALHLATKFNRINFVNKIVSEIDPQLKAQLMYQQNHKGDTPLHIASRYGRLKMIKLLTNHAMISTTESVDLEAGGAAAAPKKNIFLLENDKKDTALHDAVRNGHFKVVRILITKDLESTILHNGVGDSPLFLAVDRKKFDIAKYITKKSPECSCRGRGGMNVLHAVVIRTCPVPHSEDLLELWIVYSKHPTSIMFDFLKESKAKWLKNKYRIKTALIIITIYIPLIFPICLLGVVVCLLGVVVFCYYLLLRYIWNKISSLVGKMFSPEDPINKEEEEVAENPNANKEEEEEVAENPNANKEEEEEETPLIREEVAENPNANKEEERDFVETCEAWYKSRLESLFEWFLPDSLKREAEVLELLIKKFQVLIEESDDELQWTPLHYAAYLRHKKAVKKLLEYDETKTVVYKKDKQGMSALHIAAKEGHVEIINHIIKHYPATCELLDVKGRTILHVAVENGRYNVVKYILKRRALEDLLNEQDREDGNTPLHYAAIYGHWSILKILVDDKRVDKGVFNYRGLLAHTCVSDMELRHFQKAHISKQMYKMGGIPTLKARESSQTEDVETRKLGQLENNVIGPKNSSSGDVVRKEDPQKCRDIKEVGKNNILVITIMATVTFAVGFQIPGGIYNGHSVSAQNGKLKYFFAVFQIANTLGFCSSLAAISTHFTASTEKECGVYRHFMRFATLLTHISIWSTGVSYIMGTHLVITQHPLLAAVNLLIFGCSFFLTLIVWFIR